ncbi:MAG: hypothetical protein ACTSYV_01010 [Candidatus Heimdallarchaeaceae archaeon]
MTIIAKLRDDSTIVDSEEGNSIYSQGWYGKYKQKGEIELDPYETVLLMERNRIEIVDENGENLTLSQVVSHFSSIFSEFLIHYLLFKDLRGRGYVVKKQAMNDKYFEMYERGTTPKKPKHLALVVPMVEGVLFNIDDIDQIVKEAKEIGQQLIFAVIDSLGDVSYYSVSELEFKRIKKSELS